MPEPLMELSYFPGCSLATTARESNQSLVKACDMAGLKLVELEDWNCCGSSSAHSLDPGLALGLAARILSLAPEDRPLMTMCPSCFRNLLSAQWHLARDPVLRQDQERLWGGSINLDLEIVSFLEILHFLDRLQGMGAAGRQVMLKNMNELAVAPYYGCMAMFPPRLRRVSLPFDLLERQLRKMGARPLLWNGRHKCCGTFLTATRPEATTPLVNRIIEGALDAGADCLVTACAMCQLNLEIRCTLKNRIPIFHFTELLALALGASAEQSWFARHLVDPRPLLRAKELMA